MRCITLHLLYFKNCLWHCCNLTRGLDLNARFSLGVFVLMSSGNHQHLFCSIAPVQKFQLHEWQLEWRGSTRGTAPALASTGFVWWLPVLWSGTAAGPEHHAWLTKPPAPQAQRHQARQSCPDAASWAVLAYYKNYLWQPCLEIVPFIVLASETIKFSKLLPKQIFNPVNSEHAIV